MDGESQKGIRFRHDPDRSISVRSGGAEAHLTNSKPGFALEVNRNDRKALENDSGNGSAVGVRSDPEQLLNWQAICGNPDGGGRRGNRIGTRGNPSGESRARFSIGDDGWRSDFRR